MTIFDIKDDIKNKLGKRVKVEVYGNRNRKEVLTGVITNMYKNIFGFI